MSSIPGNVIDGTALVDSLVGSAGDDTINAYTGQDTVYGMGGDDIITIVNNGEFADVVYGGDGIDSLLAQVLDLPDTASYWMTENMYWVGYDAQGVARGLLAVGDNYGMAEADLALSQPTLNLRTSNGYPGAWIDNASFENFSQWASQRSDSNDMLLVRGTGTYNAYGGFNGLYADWHLLSEPVIWDNLANDTPQLVAGSTISNVQRLLLKTGSGDDAIANTVVESNDEIETGAGNDTVDAGRGRDRVETGAGDDRIVLVVGGEFADTVRGGSGNDTLLATAVALAPEASPWMTKNMYFSGYDALGNNIAQATATTGTMANADAVMTGAMLKLNTGNSYPGVWIEGVENLSLWAHPGDDSNDMLFVLGTGIYNGYEGFDAVYANWAAATTDITWNNQANATGQSVNGSTLSNIERLLVRTGSGNDDIRNTAVSTDDEIETGAGNDTIDAGAGRDRVDAGQGDDAVSLLVGTEFADTAHGGAGTDSLSVRATDSKSMYLGGYDAQGNFLQTAFTDSTLARVAQVLASASFKLNTGNGYPGVWFDGFENLSLIAHPADDSVDLLTVIGTGTYDGGAATDTLYADWSAAADAVVWNNLANATAQAVNGSAIRNVERLLLRTGSGNDDLRNTAVDTSDEFETGSGNDTVHAGGGQDRVDAGAGDDQVFLVLGSEFADEAHGGAGVDHLEVVASGSKSMNLVGYDANGGFVMSAYTDSSFSRVAQTLTAVTFDLNTGNGYPGVWFDGFENLSLIAHPADDSWDLLTVVGTGTYDGGGASDTLFADWGGATAGIVWNNLASSVSQSVNGSTIRNVERLLLSTGSGSDDIRNTVASTSDEFFTGPGDDVVYAGGGNDAITGGSGNDSLFGGDGNDSLVPGAGEDLADGGAGSDTAVFAGNRADYTVTRNASGTVVIVTSLTEGTDRLLAIETLQFADGSRGTSSTGTVDAAAPALASATPPSGSSGASTEADIVLTFSESVEAGSGSVWLKTSDGATVEQFDLATSTRLQISANTLTVRPTADLTSMTGYRIELDAGSLKDIVGNPIAALASYSFTTGAASYTGGSGNDSLVGDGWGNLFLTGLGNDTVDGGAGQDTAALPLFPNVFSLSAGSGAGSASGSYRAGPDTFSLDLTGIELVRFGSTFQTTVPLAELTSGRAQDSLAKLTDLYLAFFGRAPDVGGLEYWQEMLLESGRDFATISADFAWSPEAQALFPQGGSNQAFVRTVYLNCFGREPDQAGWEWWTAKLDELNPNDPQYLNNRGSFVGELILGAYAPTSGAEDRNLLTNRHEVAMDYANRLVVQPGEGFDAAINDLLERVTGDAATRTGATAVLQHVFDHPVTLTGVMGDAVLLASLWG